MAVTTASSLVAVTTAILFYWLTTAISGGDDRLRCSGDDRFRVAVTTACALSSNFATAVAAIHFSLCGSSVENGSGGSSLRALDAAVA